MVDDDGGLQSFVIVCALILAVVVAYYIGKDLLARWQESASRSTASGVWHASPRSPAGVATGEVSAPRPSHAGRSQETVSSLPPLLLFHKSGESAVSRAVPKAPPPPVPTKADIREKESDP